MARGARALGASQVPAGQGLTDSFAKAVDKVHRAGFEVTAGKLGCCPQVKLSCSSGPMTTEPFPSPVVVAKGVWLGQVLSLSTVRACLRKID